MDKEVTYVRFEHEGETWQYKNGKLQKWQGDFYKGTLNLGCQETPSPWSRLHVKAEVVNRTGSRIDCYWISNEGEPCRWGGGIPTNQSQVLNSYLGHKWRFIGRREDLKVVYELSHRRSKVIIDECPLGLVCTWEVDPLIHTDGTDNQDLPSTDVKPFIKQDNVWLRGSRDETQLSYDGIPNDAYKDVYASPDGCYAVALQCKPGKSGVLHRIDVAPQDQFRPKLLTTEHPRPGDVIEVKRPRLFNLNSKVEVFVDNGLFSNPYELVYIGWLGQKCFFLYNERGHQCMRLVSIGADGVVTTVAEDTTDTVIDHNQKIYYKILASTKELLWMSERDGWNHLYLFDLNGTLKYQVTKGEWVVRSVDRVDPLKRRIWFKWFGMVDGQDPYYAHLARVNFDGSDLKILTSGNGSHTWQWGPDGRYICDTWSRVDSLPQTVIRDAESGEQTVYLQQEALQPTETWSPAERFAAPGRDGKTLIYGVIIRPAAFDSTVEYPVIEYVYDGPDRVYTAKTFSNLADFRRVADQGYILVIVDGMGTNWRSKAFHDVSFKNVREGGFLDRIAWIKAAATTRPWMDISRVGIYGGSVGGQNAAAAVISHSDFYKAAVAGAGPHDNRLQPLLWGEMWMGYPIDEAYVACSNVVHANRLGGELMLVVGGLDEVVDPAATLRLANALIEADKDFDMVYLPRGDHFVMHTRFVERKMDAFFEQHLKIVK